MAKSEITLEAERVIKTAEYESLRVRAGFTETIEWKNETEREAGVDRLVDRLKKDFVKSHEMLTQTIGVQRSLGTGEHKNADGSKQVGNVTSDDDDFDIL